MGSTEAGRNASPHKTHPGDNVPFRETAGSFMPDTEIVLLEKKRMNS